VIGGDTMRDHDRAMMNYLALACLSGSKSQPMGRDRCLVLAAVAALRAGYPDIADACREQVVASNPRHLLASYTSLAEAILAEDAGLYFRQLERHCSYEKAEHLCQEVGDELTELEASSRGEGSSPVQKKPLHNEEELPQMSSAHAREWLRRLVELERPSR